MDNDLPEGVLRAKTVTRIVISAIVLTAGLASGWWTYQLKDARYERDQQTQSMKDNHAQQVQRLQDQ